MENQFGLSRKHFRETYFHYRLLNLPLEWLKNPDMDLDITDE